MRSTSRSAAGTPVSSVRPDVAQRGEPGVERLRLGHDGGVLEGRDRAREVGGLPEARRAAAGRFGALAAGVAVEPAGVEQADVAIRRPDQAERAGGGHLDPRRDEVRRQPELVEGALERDPVAAFAGRRIRCAARADGGAGSLPSSQATRDRAGRRRRRRRSAARWRSARARPCRRPAAGARAARAAGSRAISVMAAPRDGTIVPTRSRACRELKSEFYCASRSEIPDEHRAHADLSRGRGDRQLQPRGRAAATSASRPSARGSRRSRSSSTGACWCARAAAPSSPRPVGSSSATR